MVLQNTDIVFTYAGKTKITVRSETHPTEQSVVYLKQWTIIGKRKKKK